MAIDSILSEPARIEEPRALQDFAAVLTQVSASGQTMIVRRNGQDLAAIVSMAQLELLREIAEQQEAEQRAAKIKWAAVSNDLRPPQEWFDDTDNPFEPE